VGYRKIIIFLTRKPPLTSPFAPVPVSVQFCIHSCHPIQSNSVNTHFHVQTVEKKKKLKGKKKRKGERCVNTTCYRNNGRSRNFKHKGCQISSEISRVIARDRENGYRNIAEAREQNKMGMEKKRRKKLRRLTTWAREKKKRVASRKNKRTTGIFKQPTQPAAQKPEARKKRLRHYQ